MERGTDYSLLPPGGQWRISRPGQLPASSVESGFEKQDILELYRLIDWLMWLPEALAVAFRRQVIQYETEKSMPYVTSTERLARAEGRQEDILDILQARFNDVPYALSEQVKAIHDENVLRECLRDAALLPTLGAFQAKLCR